ncbi:MAG: hypothetical protein M1409_03405 [Actinobacteria bacterium]|nr:hypothetical protein [Actinomycetota bacterium]
MGWYISTRNCENRPKISKNTSESSVIGQEKVYKFITDLIEKQNKDKRRTIIIALEGYIGARFSKLAEGIKKALENNDLKAELIDISSIYKPRERIEKFEKQYLTDDPSFGIVCTNGWLKNLIDQNKIKSFKAKIGKIKVKNIKDSKLSAVIVYGIGSALNELKSLYDLIFYVDVTRETTVDRLDKNEVVPVGASSPQPIFWKGLYYIYYPILIKQKKYILDYMDYYVDDNTDELKLIPKKAYNEVIASLVNYPLKFKKIFMTGPWGGMMFRDYYNMPELANMCWNIEVSGMDSSLLVDLGLNGICLDLPFWNLYSKYPIEIIGPYCYKNYPGNFPIQVGLQDGYFPEPVPYERRAMPIHLHPDTKYVKNNFKESIGRYEVYYIAKTFEGANTMHGFYQDADLEEYKRKVVKAEEKKTKFDWDKYVKRWPSKEDDLYIITAGTTHGTGGNQTVVEMDTCPSIYGTEYSFFMYDYQRPSFDDKKKTFTGKPLKTQVKHGLAQTRWFMREKWVEKNLRKRPKVIRKGEGWSEEKYDSYRPMPYNIGKLNFDKKIEHDTKGRFFYYLCLSKGDRAIVRSIKNPERSIELEYLQSTVIPASFGKYECINLGKTPCTLVMQYWKRG